MAKFRLTNGKEVAGTYDTQEAALYALIHLFKQLYGIKEGE